MLGIQGLRDHHANPVAQQAAAVSTEMKKLKKKLSDAHEDTRKWKAAAHTFARAINVLTLENERLKEQTTNVRPLQSAR